MAGERKDYGRKNAACCVARCSALRCPMQRTALPLAARCNHGCSALHLKSGCSADSWGMGPASFSHLFPLLLSSFSVSSLISFRSFSHRFPLLLSFLSFSSPIAFRPSCPALPPSSYCMAKPCRPWCHAGLCCLARPRQRTCALWDGLMSCVGRGAQYWNV